MSTRAVASSEPPVAAAAWTAVKSGLANWFRTAAGAWDRFWFTPRLPHTLALLRVLAGGMLLYTHLVWSLRLEEFLGPRPWIPVEMAQRLHGPHAWAAWSHLYYFSSPGWLWTLHVAALVVLAMFTVGVFSRVTGVLTWLITVSYGHRLIGALFGLDQINATLAMYLMLGPSGAAYSVDRWLARRRAGGDLPAPEASTWANIATRLLQLHMCVIYFFGGVGKLKGEFWAYGNAFWFSVANLEYQSLDMTWLVYSPWLICLLTHVTVFWETFYCCLVWPRALRWPTLFVAFCLHGGIALFLGMKTFGLAMIFGNMAFIEPETTRAALAWLGRRVGGGRPAERVSAAPRRPK